MNANRVASLSSSKARLMISLTVCPCIATSHYHCGSEAQTTCTSKQKNKACEQSSLCLLHLLHTPLGTILRLLRLALVGRASLQVRHLKFFTLFGISILYNFFHQPTDWDEEELECDCKLLPSKRNLYLNLTEY